MNDDQIELGVEEDEDEEELLEMECLLTILFVFLGTASGVFTLFEVKIAATCCLGADVYTWVLT